MNIPYASTVTKLCRAVGVQWPSHEQLQLPAAPIDSGTLNAMQKWTGEEPEEHGLGYHLPGWRPVRGAIMARPGHDEAGSSRAQEGSGMADAQYRRLSRRMDAMYETQSRFAQELTLALRTAFRDLEADIHWPVFGKDSAYPPPDTPPSEGDDDDDDLSEQVYPVFFSTTFIGDSEDFKFGGGRFAFIMAGENAFLMERSKSPVSAFRIAERESYIPPDSTTTTNESREIEIDKTDNDGRMEAKKEQPSAAASTPVSTSCRKKKSEEATFLEDVKDHIDEFIHASMEEHATCFKKTVKKFAGKLGVAGNGDRRRRAGKMAEMPFDPLRKRDVEKKSKWLVSGNQLTSFSEVKAD
ncbi:hypothetical protein AgCh_022587 [Apium graveolens]